MTRSRRRLRCLVGGVLTPAAFLLAETARADAALGVQGGVALATFLQHGSDNFATYDSRPAARFALGAVFELGRGQWRLRLEPLYSQKGAHFMDPGCPCLRPPGYVPKDNDLRTQYVELPVLATVSSDQAGPRYYALFGPVFSYLLAARQTRDGLETDEKQGLRSWDIGLTAGGGVEGSGDHAWFVEARWTFGLVSVNDESLLNQVGQLLVGVTFRRSR